MRNDCCSCHIVAPCSYCMSWCGDCDGSGQRYVYRNSVGKVDYIDGIKTQETIECETCNGEGHINE